MPELAGAVENELKLEIQTTPISFRVSMATIRPRGWQLNILNKTKITT